MLLLPAIDLMGGEVVRLQRGDPKLKTVYSNDPVAFAKKWESLGADWLHLVDLDAAFTGTPANLDSVRAICSAVSIPCELGGGMRSAETLREAFDAGIQRVIMGTKASQSLGFVTEMAAQFGSERLAVGIDAKNGRVAIKGWQEETTQSAAELALAAQSAGAGTIIYTDIATDGMLEGPNFKELASMLDLLDCQLIASGGVSSMADLRKLARMPELYGAIIGKALYDGQITGNLREQLVLG